VPGQTPPRAVRDVVFVDGVRTPFGKAGPKGMYAETRADDMVIRCIRELVRRNPSLPPERVDDVAIAATTQIGDQGLTIGRTAALLAGLPKTVPGYAIDRMCAGALTAVTTTAGAIAFGAYDVVIAGGVEHMGHHPMGEGVDPNPRIVAEKLVDPSALVMGSTAENLHDRFPHLTKERADAFSVGSQDKLAKAYANGKLQPDLVPVATRSVDKGWGLATVDEPPRPGTTLEDLASLKTPFRPHGRVTAGNAAGLNDGATACLLAAEDVAEELGLPVRMRLVQFAFVGVEPEVMGVGPVPATEKALAKAYANGKLQPDLVPVATRSVDKGWGLATVDEPPRPGTTLEDLASLKTPFRPHGRVTAGNAAGLNDGATACLLAAEDVAEELGLPVRMRLVQFAFVGVEPEVMGVGPVPATEKALAKAGLTIDDIGLFELNEAFAVQVLAFLDHFGIADDDPRVNEYGGAIAVGHPLASSGVRLMTQLARQFEDHPEVRYGLTAMCIGIGMGGAVIWENPHFQGTDGSDTK
jgi:acetyl-CoA acyltransferase